MKITVPPEIERALADRAHKLGTTPETLVLDSLRERFLHTEPEAEEAPETEPSAQTLADFLRGHIGVLHSAERVPGGACMSEDSGKKFAAHLLKKRATGHL